MTICAPSPLTSECISCRASSSILQYGHQCPRKKLTTSGQLREALYGAFIVAIFLGFRRGVVPTLATLARRLARQGRLTSRLAPAPQLVLPDDGDSTAAGQGPADS